MWPFLWYGGLLLQGFWEHTCCSFESLTSSVSDPWPLFLNLIRLDSSTSERRDCIRCVHEGAIFKLCLPQLAPMNRCEKRDDVQRRGQNKGGMMTQLETSDSRTSLPEHSESLDCGKAVALKKAATTSVFHWNREGTERKSPTSPSLPSYLPWMAPRGQTELETKGSEPG